MQQVTDEDAALFRQAMQGVKSLHCLHTLKSSSKNNHQKLNKHQLEQIKLKRLNATYPKAQIMQDEFSEHFLIAASAAEKLYFAKAGVQLKQLNNLKQGNLRYAASLDLHGFNVEQARLELSLFLQQAHKYCWQVVHIIHGKASNKGEFATLKSYLNGWLRRNSQVLAFCSCPNKDGGTGAIYVLLKKNKNVS